MTCPTKTPDQRLAAIQNVADRARRSADPRKAKRAINMAIQHSRAEGFFVNRRELRLVRQFVFLRWR